MKLVIAGGTGFIGGRLLRRLLQEGHSVTLLTRDAQKARAWSSSGAAVRSWSEPGWRSALDGADAVVNLAGEGVADGRWTPARKEALLKSRLEVTRNLVDAMAQAASPPKLLVNASAVGFYGPRSAEDVDESSAPGKGFLADLCVQWEREALRARALRARVVLLRIGVVLGRQGGAMRRMLLPFKLGLGGKLGSGAQFFPWIHVEDVVGLILEALNNPRLEGPVNATAPEAVTNAEFTKALGGALRRPTLAAVPGFALRLLLGEMSGMLLTGQKALPRAAEAAGYRFKYPTLADGLREIVAG